MCDYSALSKEREALTTLFMLYFLKVCQLHSSGNRCSSIAVLQLHSLIMRPYARDAYCSQFDSILVCTLSSVALNPIPKLIRAL